MDSFLRKAERETERLEPIGDDLETVRRQHEDFEVMLLNKLNAYRKIPVISPGLKQPRKGFLVSKRKIFSQGSVILANAVAY